MSWRCPYCQGYATLIAKDVFTKCEDMHQHSIEGEVGFFIKQIICPNPKCKRMILSLKIGKTSISHSQRYIFDSHTKHNWDLLPTSLAKPQPDYIPSQITKDYEEACAIKDLSPKASATLARRCLQGMIRDFWGVKGKTLKAEIDEIKDKVEPEIWEAIEAIRTVGNIGAHMEKDINIIVDVDANEAQLLISLIEDLLDDWYVKRYQRKEKLSNIKKLAEGKQLDRKATNEAEAVTSDVI